MILVVGPAQEVQPFQYHSQVKDPLLKIDCYFNLWVEFYLAKIFVFSQSYVIKSPPSAVFSGGAGGARAPLEFGGSEKGQSLISAYQSLAITTSASGFETLSTALNIKISKQTSENNHCQS